MSDVDPVFLLLLESYRRQQSKQWRKRNKNPRLPVVHFPSAIEATYAQAISDIQKRVLAGALRIVGVKIDSMNGRFDADDLGVFEQMWQELENNLTLIYGASLLESRELQMLLNSVSQKIKSYNETGFSRQSLVLTGVPYTSSVLNWAQIRSAWELTNYTLIKDLSREAISRINKLVLMGFQNGWTPAQIAGKIEEVSDAITGYRANLIARDQIGKLNNKITKVLHASMGVTAYLWVTARDERVRGNPKGRYPKAIPSHWIMHYVVCRWDDSEVYTDDVGLTWKKRTADMPKVEPGMEVACRCVAVPVAIDPIRLVDKKIDGKE